MICAVLQIACRKKLFSRKKRGKIENTYEQKWGRIERSLFIQSLSKNVYKYFLCQIMNFWLTFSANNVLIHCVEITEILSYTFLTKISWKHRFYYIKKLLL